MKFSKILPSFLILILATFSFAQETTKVKKVDENSIKIDVEKVVCENKGRLEAVKSLFKEKGATDKEIKIVDFGHVKNLIVTKKGISDEIVIIGAHYDKFGGGCGAIDNWTGIVIIANIFSSIKPYKTNKTYKFVAFGEEEKGLIGSKAMAKEIPKDERINYCAMVNLDSFGFTYPQALGDISTKRLIEFAERTAKEFKFKFGKARTSGRSDSASFISKKIPAITLHGLSNNWTKYLHTSKDKIKNINMSSVYFGYLFAFRMIAKIDSKGCQEFRKTKSKR